MLRCSSRSVRYGVRSKGTYRGAGTWAFSKTVGSRFLARRRRGRRLATASSAEPAAGSESSLYNECVDPLITRGSDMSVNPCRSSSVYRGRCVRVVVCVGPTIVLWGSPPASRVYRSAGQARSARLAVAGAAVASRESDRMSLGPQWCLGVLFGCFCLGKRLALGRGHLERTWWTWAEQGCGAGNDGLGRRGDATHASHVGFVARILVSYRTLSNILVALSGGKSPRIRGGAITFDGQRPHVSLARPFAA